MSEYHEEIVQSLRAKSAGTGWHVPSASFVYTGGRFLDYVTMRSLLCEYPVPETAASFDGTVAFGWISNLIEQTAVHLAFLAAGEPCVPVSVNMNCIRPMSTLHGPITIEAKLRNRTKSLVFMEAKVSSGEHRTIATAAVTFTTGPSQRDN